MAEIGWLGTGAMGVRMAARLMAAGHRLRVWNRTAERCTPLVEAGATLAKTPRAAAAGAEAVFSMVRDDAASAAVWLDPEAGALAALGPEAIGIECSTLSHAGMARLHHAAAAAETGFLDAPVAGSRPQAEAGALIFLVGGADAPLARARPLLERLGGETHHAGGPGAGAVVKLMVNALFGAQAAMMGELIGFAEKAGLDPSRAVEILTATPVASPAAKGVANAMLTRAFAPAFPIELVDKDFALVTETAAAFGAETPLSAAARAVFARAVGAGFGADNITGVVQLHRG